MSITWVEGVRVGHWTDPRGPTGCTVILPPAGTVGSCQVFGGAPGTRETDLLRPGMLVEHVDAILLSGGSAFGLAAADGVVRFLEERGVGFPVGELRVPIVPAAVLFDLDLGDPAVRPGPEAGYVACGAAWEMEPGAEVAEGLVGAGAGTTVARMHRLDPPVRGGIGTSGSRRGDLAVGAIAAVNALGDVIGADGEVLAGAPPGTATEVEPGPGNTTLVAVATNARLSKERAHLLALAAHRGFDSAIRPAHTIWDGDVAFSLATGRLEADQRLLEDLAEAAVATAIRRAVVQGVRE